MGASAQFVRPNPRLGWSRTAHLASRATSADPQSMDKPAIPAGEHRWLVDVDSLARCRALFSGRALAPAGAGSATMRRPPILMDVPPAFDSFCHSHFAAVKRIHPELTWEDACQAYAIALSAHASLHVALDQALEQQLEQSWDDIRGQLGLEWKQARSLIADGCSALDRLDPLAIRR